VSEPAVGFVGGGRIVRIMLAGWRRAGRPLSDVIVSDLDSGVLERLKAEFPAITVTGDNRQAAKHGIVFVALHPPAFPGALAEIKDSLSAGSVLVSLAPRWTMSWLSGSLGGFSRLARAIPNAPSIVNSGYNPVSFSRHLAPGDRARVTSLLTALGSCPEVEEATLEAYLWYQLYQLIDLGHEFGLTREAATEAVAAMLTGAAGTMVGAGMTPDGVMDLIPVKPLAPIEQIVKEAYVNTLGALHTKLTG
jgi:pyrroline-5-carboxylate reductase